MTPSFIFLEEYIAAYRKPFFESLIQKGHERGLNIGVASGQPSRQQGNRGDRSIITSSISIKQREFKIFGRRVVVRRVWRLISKADFVVMNHALRNLDLFFALLLRRGSKVALWSHGKDFVRQASPLRRAIYYGLARMVNHVFVYTSEGREFLLNNGVDPLRVTVVQNSIDTQTFANNLQHVTKLELMEFAKAHDLRGSTALYVGGLDQSKNIKLLLESALIAHRDNSAFRMLVAGDGTDREMVEKFAEDHSFLRFIGRIDGKSKAIAALASNVIAVPGRVGLVALEALVSGKPLVTTTYKYHAPEFAYLTPGESVFIADETATGFASVMSAVISTHPLKGQFSKRTSNEVIKHFSVELMAQNFINGFDSMAHGK